MIICGAAGDRLLFGPYYVSLSISMQMMMHCQHSGWLMGKYVILHTWLQFHTLHVPWKWDESFCQHNKAKGNGSESRIITTMTTELRSVPTCSPHMLLFAHHPSISTQYIQSACDYSMLGLICSAHAPCKHKQLATIVNPCVVLWQWMDTFNQYNPLNRDGHRLLQG